MRVSVFLLCCLLFAAPATAWDRDAADFVEQGRALYAEGRFAEAAEMFRSAYAIDPDPNQLFNEARCHESLGALETALGLFERFLQEKPLTPHRERVTETIRQISWTLSRTKKRIEIRSIPPGAVVFLDGAEVPEGETPLRRWLAEGAHIARLSLEGYPTQEQPFHVSRGGPDWFSVALVPAPKPVPEPAPVPATVAETETVTVAETVTVTVTVAETVTETDGFRYPPAAIGTTVLTAGALAGGVTMHVLAEGHDARRYRLWGNLGFGVAAAGALSTAILLIVANGPQPAEPPPVAVAPSPGGLTAVWSGRF